MNLGHNLLKQQKPSEAEPLLRKSLAVHEKLEAEDWRTFAVKSLLGAALSAQKKYTEAEPLLLAGYEGMKQREAKIPKEGRARLTEALERLVQFYDVIGKSVEAAKWRNDLEQAKRK